MLNSVHITKVVLFIYILIAHFQVKPWETASYYQGHEKEVILSYNKNPSKQTEKGDASRASSLPWRIDIFLSLLF